MKKELLYFIGGVAAGAIVSGSVTYILSKKKYEDIVNNELAKIKRDAVDYVAKDYTVVKRPTEEELKEEDEVLKAASLDIHNRVATHVDYAAYGKTNMDEDHKLEAPDEDIPNTYPVEDEEKIPYVIDEDAIEPNYDICCLTYYEADNTLADDSTGDIVLPEDTVSTKLLDLFVESDEDQVCICKDSHSTVYEVTRYPGSYRNEVLGLPDDDGGETNGGEFIT